jgi:hypothetical protein
MTHSISLLIFAAVICPLGLSQPCLLGIANPEARVKSDKSGQNGYQGEVRFRITNLNCPSGGANRVRVGAGPIETTGTLTVTGWKGTNILNVIVPPPGLVTEIQTLEFQVEGSGSVKFQLSIDLCNGQDCKKLEWTLSPNNVPTDPISFR